MEPTMNLIPTPVDGGVHTDEMTKLPLASPHNSEKEDGVDLGHERATESESNEAIDTENGSESADKNQSPETVVDVARARESETEPDSLDDDVEIVIKNQHKYYIYCPCCGEDITKTVKLVKKSDLQPTENEAIDTKNGSRFKDKKIKFPSWFPVNLQHLFHSLYRHHKDKGKKEVDLKSPTVSSIDLGIDDKEQSVNVKFEFERPSFPKWYLDVFAWLFLCIIIALSVLFTSPQQSPSVLSTSPQPFILPHPQLPSVSSLQLPSASVLLLLPTFAVLFLVILAMRTRYGPRFQKEKGDKSIDSKSSDTASEEQSRKTQYQDEQTADPGQEADKKTDNQKVHLLDTSPHEQPSMQIVNKETHENAESETPAKTQTEPELQSNTQLEIPNSLEEPHKGGTTLEILKSIVYGGLTESITSLCTVTSAAASGASTLNIFALGVANLSSGLLLIFHNLQELINEKPRKRTNNIDDQTNSEEERDRYEEILGRREKSKLHSFIAISSFFVCGMIPPLVYCFSFRQRFEKRQEYKTLAVYGVSLVCVVLLSFAKAYVSKRREYLKTLFRYTAMATTASGLSQFVGYLVSRWLEKSGFYDDSPQTTPRV